MTKISNQTQMKCWVKSFSFFWFEFDSVWFFLLPPLFLGKQTPLPVTIFCHFNLNFDERRFAIIQQVCRLSRLSRFVFHLAMTFAIPFFRLHFLSYFQISLFYFIFFFVCCTCPCALSLSIFLCLFPWLFFFPFHDYTLADFSSLLQCWHYFGGDRVEDIPFCVRVNFIFLSFFPIFIGDILF